MTKKLKTRKTKVGIPSSLHKLYPNVKSVVDADEAVAIEVCKPDVTGAQSMDPTNCALARAVKREFNVDAAIIGISTSYIIKGDKAVRFATPESVSREIVSFDRHHDFEPGNYHLTPKSPTSRFGSQRGPSSNKKSGNKKKIHIKRSRTSKIRVLARGQN